MSCLIWTPLKLVPPRTNFSEIFGPTLKKKFVPTILCIGQPHEGKSVTTKDISRVHSCISRKRMTVFHKYASTAPHSVLNVCSSQTLHNVCGN